MSADPQSPADAVRFSNPMSEENQAKLDGAEVEITKVPASLFKTPFKALGASGGTAAFFRVEYEDDEWPKDKTQAGVQIDSKDYWIGKDLARARDEVAFYEEAQKRIGLPGWDVLKWTTPYKGCVDAPTDIGDREVLLLRNARDNYGTCRLLDIKIGEVTAVGGWQGKGHFVSLAAPQVSPRSRGLTSNTSGAFVDRWPGRKSGWTE
jgi:hypothetical protein